MRLLKYLFCRLFPVIVILFFSSALHAQESITLEYFIKSATQNSPLLTDLNNQAASAKLDSLKLRAGYGFLVSGEASGSYAPVIGGWGYDEIITNKQSLFAGVNVSKTLLSKGNKETHLSAFHLQVQQILAKKKVSVQTLKNTVSNQYILTYTAQEQLNINCEIIDLLEKEDVILQKLTRSAVFRQADYLAFKVTLQQSRLDLEQQKADLQNNYALLKYLSGIIDTEYLPLEPPDFAETLSSPGFSESVYAASFRADSLKLANESKVIGYDYKPQISLISNAGYQSALTITPYKNFGIMGGFAITFPIYDGRQKKMLLMQNQLAEDTREKYEQKAQRQYEQKTQQLNGQINQYEKMLNMANEQIRYSETLVQANGKQLPTGDVHITDFILSIQNFLTLKTNIILYRANIMELQNQLQNLILQ